MEARNKPSYRESLLTTIIVLALIIQPCWTSSQRYQGTSETRYTVFTGVGELLLPGNVHAAPPRKHGLKQPRSRTSSHLHAGGISHFVKPSPPRTSKKTGRKTPAKDTVCDSLSGALFGLCNAYCAAMNCDSDGHHASERACQRVLDNFLARSGGELPPCMNKPPVARAGPNQTVFVTDTVRLNGSHSGDVNGDRLTFFWSFRRLPDGSNATLSDPTAVMPIFNVDRPGTYVVELVVNDGRLDSTPDTVTISTKNSPPVSDAGPDQTAFVGDTVPLDGSGSTDIDGDAITFQWYFVALPAGSMATLADATVVTTTFVLDLPGIYVVELVVNDGRLDSTPDTVTITTNNSPPVANAGSHQTVFVGDTARLDGRGSSDVDGDPLKFQWSLITLPLDSVATLSEPTAVDPTFMIDQPGTYVAQLIVNDGTVNSAPDTVMTSTANTAPVADAGVDQTASVRDTVQLDGSGSHDVDGDPLTFFWALTVRPPDSHALLSNPTSVDPGFVVDVTGTYVAQLIVNDGTVDSTPDTVTTTTVNTAPVADTGPDQTVFAGDTVQLDGSGSHDAEDDPLTFQWLMTPRPDGSMAALSAATAASPTFDADVAGTYTVQLIVNDGQESSLPDPIVITVLPQVGPFGIAGAIAIESGRAGFLTVTLQQNATADTPLSVFNSNPTVATLDGMAIIPAGEQSVNIPIAAMREGTSIVTITIGNTTLFTTVFVSPPFIGTLDLLVVVGAVISGGPTLASSVGSFVVPTGDSPTLAPIVGSFVVPAADAPSLAPIVGAEVQ